MASLIMGINDDRQIIVSVWLSIPVIQPFNNVWIPSRALIDTGANISGVSTTATDALLYTATSRGLTISYTSGYVSTPNQEEQDPKEVSMYDVDVALGIEAETSFQKISSQTTNWIYQSLKVSMIQPRQNYDMLLGMDFLQHCHLSMSKNTLILSN